jgi:hypothetical protein
MQLSVLALNICQVLFVANLAFGVCVFIYYYYLRVTGVIPWGWRMSKRFEKALATTQDEQRTRRIKLCRNMYLIFIDATIIIIILLVVTQAWVDPSSFG